MINIDKEVQKYQSKKEKLLNNLLYKLNIVIGNSVKAIDNIDNTVVDLNVQRGNHQDTIKQAKEVIHKVS